MDSNTMQRVVNSVDKAIASAPLTRDEHNQVLSDFKTLVSYVNKGLAAERKEKAEEESTKIKKSVEKAYSSPSSSEA